MRSIFPRGPTGAALLGPAPVLAGIGGAALCVAALLLRNDPYSLVYYGDAAAHLVRTRQFVDSLHPGIENIGTVWLPLPHLLLLPFAAIGLLFRTGAAGLFVGIPALLATAWLLYDGTRRLTGSVVAAAAAALVFGLNPNQIYLSITPMTEPVLLLFFTGTLYACYRWTAEPEKTSWLAAASALTALATLSRYEAWPLPAALALLCLFRAWRVRGSFRLTLHEALAVLGSFAGIAAWIWWNWHLYGDPWRFVVETREVGSRLAGAGLRGHPFGVLRLFLGGALQVFGPLFPAFTAWIVLRRKPGGFPAPLALLLLPAGFTVVALAMGYVQMDTWGWNVRYVLVLAPFAAVLAGTVVAEAGRESRWLLAGAVLGVALAPLLTPFGVATYNDAARQFRDETVWATDAGRNIGALYEGGGVVLFTGYGQGQRIMMPSGLDLRHFEVVLPSSDPELHYAPWRSFRYLVVALHPSSEAQSFTSYWLQHFDVLLEHYSRRWGNREYLLLERRETPVAEVP